jgi:hypothetical protein
MICVILESPYSGDQEANCQYARQCVADSLARGEAPIASHLLYTQPGILDDSLPEDRQLGIEAGHAWIERANKMVVYIDLGISHGMWQGMERARQCNVQVEKRSIFGNLATDEEISRL